MSETIKTSPGFRRVSTIWFEAIEKCKEFETEATEIQILSLKELKQGKGDSKNMEECKVSIKRKLKE